MGVKLVASSGGSVELVPTNTASNFTVTVPAATGTVLLNNSSDQTINGLTVGRGAGAVSTNTAVGASALAANTTGSLNTVVGYFALDANTSGDNNSVFGYAAMGDNSTGSNNSAIGVSALTSNTTGGNNTAVGRQALVSNTTASRNTAVGYQTLYTNIVGTYNCAVGYQAGYNATGNGGTFIGDTAGYSVTTGTWNTFIGQNAGYNVTTGGKNTIIGNYSGNQGGLDIRTASNYVVLSDGDGNPRAIIDNYGTAYFDTLTNTATTGGNVLLGPSTTSAPRLVTGHATGTVTGATYAIYYYAGTSIGSITQNGTTAVLYNTTSDYRLKTDVLPINNALSTIGALNPVSFTWVDGRKDDGFLAHEIQAIIPNCVTGEKDAVDEDGKPAYQQMDNSGVIPFLVKAIQEQQAIITSLTDRITALENK